MRDLLLGIDIGTGGCKTTLIDADGNFVADGFAEYPTYHPQPAWSEQEPSDWFQAFLKALGLAEESGRISRRQIIGISVSGSTHNAVLLDRNDCIVRNTIMWTDQRSHAESKYLKDNYGETFFKIGYQLPAPTWTASQLLWLKRHCPSDMERTAKVMFVKDYIRYQLTGVWCTDYIEAQGSLLFDNRCWAWSPELCGIVGVSPAILPPIVQPGDVVGHITAEASRASGVREGIPVVAGTSDTALEHYCVGGINVGDSIVKIATASTVDIIRGSCAPHPAALNYSQVPAGMWTTCFATSSAAASLRWYRDTFCRLELLQEGGSGKNVYQKLDQEAAAVAPGSAGLFFHPYLMGERSPYWDPNLRGSFVGISAGHTRGHFNRAILEGVAYSIKENFQIASTLQDIEKVRLVGGGAKSRLWTDITCNMLNRPIVKFEKDDSSFGAAMLAGVGIGVFASHQEAVARCTRESYHAKPDAGIAAFYEMEFKKYRQIHDELETVYAH